MSEKNPLEKEVSYSYPTEAERIRAKNLPPQKPQKEEKNVEQWGEEANSYLKHHNLPKRVVDVDGGQELYNSTWHNFLIIFFILVLIGGIIFGCWGIYNDKFKTVFYDNSTVVCEAPTIPTCPTAPACPACPGLSCGNVTVQIPDNLKITVESNLTEGNESD